MSAESAFYLHAVYYLRPCPAFWRLQYEHRPARTGRDAFSSSIELNLFDLGDYLVERCSHLLMHRLRFVSLDYVRCVAVATEELLQFLLADPGKHRRVGDLVAVEVKDR